MKINRRGFAAARSRSLGSVKGRSFSTSKASSALSDRIKSSDPSRRSSAQINPPAPLATDKLFHFLFPSNPDLNPALAPGPIR
jgi:hypothetical protein